MQPQLSKASRVVVARDQVSCDLDGEAAILNLTTGVYYGLDKLGARIWRSIQQPVSVSAVCDLVVNEYEVDAATAESDLLAFLTEMMKEGLVELLPDEATHS